MAPKYTSTSTAPPSHKHTKLIEELTATCVNVENPPDHEHGPDAAKWQDLVDWMESLAEPSDDDIKNGGIIDRNLEMFRDSQLFNFPDDIKQLAGCILEMGWRKKKEVLEEESAGVTSYDPKEKYTRDRLGTIRLPPANHKDFKRGGLMYGLAAEAKGRRYHWVWNPNFEKYNCDKVGDIDGVELGKRFPYQMVALAYGVHGRDMQGIHGNEKIGAVSIIASGLKESMNPDEGNTLYYSAREADDHTDPNELPTPKYGGKALKAAYEKDADHTVRVIRSAKDKKSEWKPALGLRYDGLYKVVGYDDQAINEKGGRYEKFKLERVSKDDDEWEKLKAIPSGTEKGLFQRLEKMKREEVKDWEVYKKNAKKGKE